jgi:hypothetical protein
LQGSTFTLVIQTEILREKHIGFWWESQKERDNKEDINVRGRIILKWMLEKYGAVLWTAVIRLRTGTIDSLLWTW